MKKCTSIISFPLLLTSAFPFHRMMTLETPSESFQLSCLCLCISQGLCLGSRCISPPLLETLCGCAYCLGPALVLCDTFFPGVEGQGVSSSFWLYPPYCSWSAVVHAERIQSLRTLQRSFLGLSDPQQSRLWRPLWSRRSIVPDLVDKSDGLMIHHLGSGIWAAHKKDIFWSGFCSCCCCCFCSSWHNNMFWTIFWTFSSVRGFWDEGCDTGSAGFTIAGGSCTTGTWTVSLPSIRLCHSFCVSRSFSGLVLREELVFVCFLARCFTYCYMWNLVVGWSRLFGSAADWWTITA